MKNLLNLIILPAALLSIPAVAQEATIFPKGEKAPNVHHTGDVWLSHVSDADSTFDYNIAHVVMAPGAKLDWHLHPEGQQLIITEGTGSYQERNKPVQIPSQGGCRQMPSRRRTLARRYPGDRRCLSGHHGESTH